MRRNSILFILLFYFPVLLFSQNKKKIDSLLSILRTNPPDTVRVNTYNTLCFEYQKINPDTALGYAVRAEKLSDRIQFSSGKATAIHNTGNIHYFKGEFAKAIACYETALKLRELIGNKKDIARTLGNIGNVHFAKGNYDEALKFYQLMFDSGNSIKDPVTLADANGNIANVYMMYGNYDKSLFYNLKSLKIREELNDKNGMEHSYNNIGGIYFNQGNDQKALEYISKSLVLQQNVGNKKGMADSYQNLGSIYYHLGSMDTAFSFFDRSLKITEELGNRSGIANAYDNLGSIYKETKQYAKALEFHLKAVHLFEKIGDQKGMANAYDNVGGDYILSGDYAAAIQNINKALEIGKRTGAKYYVKNSYDYFVQLYKKMKDPKKALAYYELSAAYGDSLLNEESANSIAEMQAKFDTEKKEKEIELLQKDKKLKELALTAGDEKNRSLQTLLYVLMGGIALMGILVFLVYRGNKQKRKNNELLENTNRELNHQKEITEQKNQLITDSVDYAQTLIDLRLPTENDLKKFFKGSICLIKAADIIGGCMYALFQAENKVYIAVVDCGTKGIPGAFLALRAQQSFRQIMSGTGANGKKIEDVFHLFKKELEVTIGLKDLRLALIENDLSTKTLAVEYSGLQVQQGGACLAVGNMEGLLAPLENEKPLNYGDRMNKKLKNNSSSDIILAAFWI